MSAQHEQRFAQIFRMNILRRSRTRAGRDEGAKTSLKKRPLLLSEEDLIKKVVENTENLIANVAALPIEVISPGILRKMAPRWFQMTADGLYDFSAYEEEFKALQDKAERFGQSLGEKIEVSRNYRLWTPNYTTADIPPLWIQKFMDEFYFNLSFRMNVVRHACTEKISGTLSELAAQTFGYADTMMDGEIHPWIDGCSRISTALVMYIARYLKAPLPLFSPNREEHYASITDISAHTAYFRRAIERAKNEVPE